MKKQFTLLLVLGLVSALMILPTASGQRDFPDVSAENFLKSCFSGEPNHILDTGNAYSSDNPCQQVINKCADEFRSKTQQARKAVEDCDKSCANAREACASDFSNPNYNYNACYDAGTSCYKDCESQVKVWFNGKDTYYFSDESFVRKIYDEFRASHCEAAKPQENPSSELQAEEDTNEVPLSESEDEVEETGLYTNEQGNLKEMEDMLSAVLGPDSDVSKTLDECEKSKKDTITKCQQSSGGWSVDVSIGINDLVLKKDYGFQDYRTGGCKKSRKFRDPLTVKIEKEASFAAELSQNGDKIKSHQVSCVMQCSSWDCEDTYMALVKSYKGSVVIIRNSVAVPIEENTAIQEGDIIATGEDGEIFFKLVGGYNEQTGNFGDKSYVEVKPNSKLLIIDPEIGAVVIEGNAKPHIEKGSNRKYTITTPTARVVAKGTDFLVSVEPTTGKTDVSLYEGTLEIIQLSTNEYITINSNEKVTVDAQALGKPTQISDNKTLSVANIKPVSEDAAAIQPENKTLAISSERPKGGSSIILIVVVLILAAIAGGVYYFIKLRK